MYINVDVISLNQISGDSKDAKMLHMYYVTHDVLVIQINCKGIPLLQTIYPLSSDYLSCQPYPT